METLGRFINFLEKLQLNTSIFPADSFQKLNETSRLYPLVNHTALFNVAPIDFIRPGIFDVQQSTLPFYQVLLNVGAFIVWIIVFLYIWKFVYYPVDDPYASLSGTTPPEIKEDKTNNIWEAVYTALDTLYDAYGELKLIENAN